MKVHPKVLEGAQRFLKLSVPEREEWLSTVQSVETVLLWAQHLVDLSKSAKKKK